MTRAATLFLALPLCLAVMSGCNDSSTPSSVSGKVTYKGESVPSGSLTFHMEGGGVYHYALREGAYSGSDMPAGTYVVTIETETANPNQTRPPMVQPGGKGKADANADYQKQMQERGMIPNTPGNAGPYVKIPAKYADEKTSLLKVTLTRGSNTNNFELTD